MKRKLLPFIFASCICLTACSFRMPAACQAQENPAAPTEAPAEEPTTAPTEEPTVEPTEEPTAEPTADPEPDQTEPYREVLNQYLGLFANPESPDGELPVIMQMLAQQMGRRAAWQVGYTTQDLSGDGIPELVIGSMEKNRTQIYAIYTLSEGTPELVLEGWERNAYYWGGDGLLKNRGSAGAAYSIYAAYRLSEDGRTANCQDYWYTHEVDGDYENIGCYHNTTGEMTGDASEKMDWTLDEFSQNQDAYFENLPVLSLEPLAELADWKEEVGWVDLCFAEQLPEGVNAQSIPCLDKDAEDYATKIGVTGYYIQDFRLMRISLTDYTEDGPVFDTEVVWEEATPTKEQPLIFDIPFYGDLPSWGIAYRDADGTEHRMTIELSGYDGSLVWQEF